ncbi:MAG: GGDEF domain-containing protein, partial [Clostridia bacterium]|nr:GGDEF domain-containing protein [Clostridia bacterium]
GLLNRRGFQAAIASIRTENLPLAVCMFVLDNLKKVNDTVGPDTGDRMIRAFADLLRSQTRTEDVLCRYGGDEFAVILKHLDSVQTAMDLGQRICSQFNDSLMEESLDASCSGGIAVCGKDERDLQLLLEKADEALRRAKQKGKSQCLLWE